MKRIVFIRHAKAEDSGPQLSDFERSLVLSGKNTARLMARVLLTKTDNLGVIVSSPAFRAIETAMIFAREFEHDPASVILKGEIYHSFTQDVLFSILANEGSEENKVTVVGHNLAISEIASLMCSEPLEEMPKSSVISLAFEADRWKEVSIRKGKLEYFLKPKTVL